MMKLQIKVNNEGIIEDALSRPYGCGSAVASSSPVTEWVKGKSLDEAQAIKNTDIAGRTRTATGENTFYPGRRRDQSRHCGITKGKREAK